LGQGTVQFSTGGEPARSRLVALTHQRAEGGMLIPRLGTVSPAAPKQQRREMGSSAGRRAADGYKSRDMRQEVEGRIAEFFMRNQRTVAAVYLFGSTARDEARPTATWTSRSCSTRPPAVLNGPRFSLEGELEHAVGRRADMVTLNDAPVDLRIRVLREGRRLLDCHPSSPHRI
jgi:predicted nucleotidyltransferase